MKQSPRVLIISQALAPAVGGSPILMNNLFSAYSGEISAISGYPGERIDPAFLPTFPTEYYNPPSLPLVGHYLKRYHDSYLKYIHPVLISRMVKTIRSWKPDVVFSHCPDIDYFICAYQAAQKCGVPFYTHMHDLWEENHSPDSYIGQMAVRWEKEILTKSKRLLCMTSIQQQHYQQKYNINSELLPHTIPDEVLDRSPQVFHETKDNTILFTGTVSRVMNLDSLRVLAEATPAMKHDMKVMLCTSAKHDDFRKFGIESSSWDIRWMSRDEVQQLQRQTGILFAPLSHKNGGMDEVRTVFSTKLLEYLISGRPILVFAPKDSFHAISARQGGWALVIDEDDPARLASEAWRLLNDIDLQMNLVDGAYREAQSRRSSIYAHKLMQLIAEDSQKKGNSYGVISAYHSQ